MVTMFRNGFSDSGMSPEGTKTSLEEEGEKMSSSAIVVEIAADIDGEKLRRAVHSVMPLCVEFGFIVQQVVEVLEDHEDSRFEEWLYQIFFVQSSAVTDVFVEVSTSTTTDV